MRSNAAGSVAPIRVLPSALEEFPSLMERVGIRPLRLFLDFDGTLAGIVDDPESAALLPGLAPVLARLASRGPVAVVSGRERTDVQRRIPVEGLTFAGSHGLDIQGPGLSHRVGQEGVTALDRVYSVLAGAALEVSGVQLERKSLGLAVHFRKAAPESHEDLHRTILDIAAGEPALRVIRGKMVLELCPSVAWNKGDAVRWLESQPGFAGSGGLSIYIGDDLTDEDGFAALGPEGVGIVVRGENDERLSAARFALSGPGEVARFLELMAAHVDPRV